MGTVPQGQPAKQKKKSDRSNRKKGITMEVSGCLAIGHGESLALFGASCCIEAQGIRRR